MYNIFSIIHSQCINATLKSRVLKSKQVGVCTAWSIIQCKGDFIYHWWDQGWQGQPQDVLSADIQSPAGYKNRKQAALVM